MTDAEKALKILSNNICVGLPIGYWKAKDGFVFLVKLFDKFKDLRTPALYVVTNSGEVYGTNPMMVDVDYDKMVKIKR